MPPIQHGIFFILLSFLQFNTGYTQDSCPRNEVALTRLRKTIFCGYDRIVRPVVAERDTVYAFIHLYVRYIDLDEATHALTVSTWTELKWKDAFLKWNPQIYEGISSIMVKSDDIWVPDLSLLSTAQVSEVQYGLPQTRCLVSSAGDVHCTPSFTHVAHCASDLAQWPFDEQKCTLLFGSWAHTTSTLNTSLEGRGISTYNLEANTAWELLDASAEIELLEMTNNDTYTSIKFLLKLRRHSGAHLATVVVPALILSVMTLLTLFLEATCPERITLGCMNALAHCLYLQYLGMKLPPNGDTVPAVVVFFRDSMLMVGASLVLAVMVRGVAKARTKPPEWLSSFIGIILSTRPGQIFLLCQLSPMSSATASAAGEDRDTLVDAEGGSVSGDGGSGGGAGGGAGGGGNSDRAAPSSADMTWLHTARLLDRVALVVFCITFFTLLVGYVP